jgi:hypothetical protein
MNSLFSQMNVAIAAALAVMMLGRLWSASCSRARMQPNSAATIKLPLPSYAIP